MLYNYSNRIYILHWFVMKFFVRKLIEGFIGHRFIASEQFLSIFKINCTERFHNYPNKRLNTSSILPTVFISIAYLLRSKPFLLYLEMNICSKPNFSASMIRCSIRFTARISPERPTSAAKQVLKEIGMSS